MKQTEFDFEAGRSTDRLERERLSRHAQAIVDRLRRGTATNDELMMVSRSRNLSARISEVRKAGFQVDCIKLERATGLAWYELKAEPPAARQDAKHL